MLIMKGINTNYKEGQSLLISEINIYGHNREPTRITSKTKDLVFKYSNQSIEITKV